MFDNNYRWSWNVVVVAEGWGSRRLISLPVHYSTMTCNHSHWIDCRLDVGEAG